MIFAKRRGWACKWKFVKRITERNYNRRVIDVFVDTNKNGLMRYKKVIVVETGEVFNGNHALLK